MVEETEIESDLDVFLKMDGVIWHYEYAHCLIP